MSAKKDLRDLPGDPEILRNILRISPTSKLTDKRVGASELRDLALKDRNKVASHASAIPNLVALLSTEIPSDIKEHVVVALAHVALTSHDSQVKVVSAGAIPLLVALLSASSPANLQGEAAVALGNIVLYNPGNQAKVAFAAPTPAHVQDHALIALGNLVVKNPANQGKAASAGAFPPLVALLSASTPADMQEHASRALAELVDNNPANQGKAASADAIRPLVALLSANTPAHVQEHASRALAHLAYQHTGNQGKVASAGAIPPLMVLLSASTQEQETAAKVLSHLVANNTDNQDKVASAGAIPPLVALLSSNTPGHLQELAAHALARLVINNYRNQVKVAATGAIPFLVAMLSASNPDGVQEQAVFALTSLANNNRDNQVKVVSANGIPPLVVSLSTRLPPSLQQAVMLCLMQIAASSTDSREIVATAITPLVKWMTYTLTPASVCATAASIVTTLLSDPRVRAVFTSATPFLPLISSLQVNCPEHVLDGTASVLSHLACISPSIRRELAAAGIIPSLMAVRAASSTPPDVQEQLDMLHVALQDVCSCRYCKSRSKRMNAQTSLGGSSTSVLERPMASSSVAEPVDSNKLMQELLEEEEREKSVKEAKATTKKEKKQRQKEKKKGKEKGKEKSKDEQVAADLVSEGGDKDAEKHLMQQQPAGEGGAGGGSGGVELSGSGAVVVARDRELVLAPSESADTRSSAPSSTAIGIANISVATALPAVTSAACAADTTPDTTPFATADDATPPIASSPAAAAAAPSADAAPVVDVAARSAAATAPSASSPSLTSNQQQQWQQQHPILQVIMSRTAVANLEQTQSMVQPQLIQPQLIVQPRVVQPQLAQPGTPWTPVQGDIALTLGRAAQTSTSTPLAQIPSFRSPPATVGAYQPLRRQPPYTSVAPSTYAATSPTVPSYAAIPPCTTAAPSIEPLNTNPVRRTAYPPPPLAAHHVRPVVAGHISATQPATYPAHIQQLRHPAQSSAGPPLPPIPTAVPSALPRISLQQAQGAVGGMAAGAHDDDELLCVVCFERERNVFLQPCGHVIMCSRCCDEVLAKSSACPICRAQVLEHAILE
eukprot:gene25152-biopygen19622